MDVRWGLTEEREELLDQGQKFLLGADRRDNQADVHHVVLPHELGRHVPERVELPQGHLCREPVLMRELGARDVEPVQGGVGHLLGEVDEPDPARWWTYISASVFDFEVWENHRPVCPAG